MYDHQLNWTEYYCSYLWCSQG